MSRSGHDMILRTRRVQKALFLVSTHFDDVSILSGYPFQPQPGRLLLFTPGYKTSVCGNNSPPGVAVAVAQEAPDSSCAPRKASFLCYFAVGQDLARFYRLEDFTHCLPEGVILDTTVRLHAPMLPDDYAVQRTGRDFLSW